MKIDIVQILINILIFIIVYIIIEFIKAKISFAPYQRWWKSNYGSEYKNILDLTPLSLFNKSKIVYNLYQKYF